MHRIDTPTAQKDKFGAGKNGFTRGNPQTGTPATELDDDYFDAIQEELVGVIEASGVAPDKNKRNQLLGAMKLILLSRAHPFADIKADGAATVYEALSNLGFTFGTNWIRFPSGHIAQYGFAGGFDSYTVVLHVPYSTNSYAVLAGGSGALSGGDSSRVFVETGIVDNGSFTAVCINAAGVRNARGINWIAFGK